MLLRQSIDYYKYSALCCLLFIHGLCKYQSSNIRVMCKNIFYLICIQIEIANKDTLIKKEYLGQYGFNSKNNNNQ